MNIKRLGWNSFFEANFQQYAQKGYEPGRVIREDRLTYLIATPAGELAGEVSGKFRHLALARSDFPAVGDWVAMTQTDDRTAVIHAVVTRKNRFSRKVAGTVTEEQVAAANIDTAFLVSGLDHNFNVRRIERYLTLAWDSEASPVVVLNKSDLCPEIEDLIDEIGKVTFGAPTYPVSAITGDGLNALAEHLRSGTTAVFLGSSGVGKSSLINALYGQNLQTVREVRAYDSKGRHTTTRRELLFLPNGAMVIDTPGLREIQLWANEESIARSFTEIEELSNQCRFRDCKHEGEPGCAVRRAIQDGEIDDSRFSSYKRQQKEIRHLERRQDERLRRQEERAWGKRMKKFRKEIYRRHDR